MIELADTKRGILNMSHDLKKIMNIIRREIQDIKENQMGFWR